MFKGTIKELKTRGHRIQIIAREKDVLIELLNHDNQDYINSSKDRIKSRLRLFEFILRFINQYKILKNQVNLFQPQLLVGTSFVLPWISKKYKIPFLNFVEDDYHVIPLYALISFPFSTYIISPHVCNVGRWKKKKIGYNGYHELAFLHPDVFTPSRDIANKYINTNKKNYIIRITAFNAHHDIGKKGIDLNTLEKLVSILKKKGIVHISSELPLSDHYEKLKISIPPNDIHHVMSFSTLIIGDSQSMAMEAACLGVPSVRMNDYNDSISVLNELENKYHLNKSLSSNEKKLFLELVEEKSSNVDNSIFKQRAKNMICEKINVQEFINELIIYFPSSISKLKNESKKQTLDESKYSTHFSFRKSLLSSSGFILIYFMLLVSLYLIPLEGNLKLHSYRVLNIRLDYIIHALFFIPIPFLMKKIVKKGSLTFLRLILASIAIAISFESLHLFISHRAFAPEDIYSNLFGVAIGTVLLFMAVTRSIK